jgi:LmbE family N-acetylglucosaminyl deacetylase
MPEHVYLAAHLDDVVYSCGGLIYHQVRSGQPCTVLTAFAGDPPPGSLSSFALELHRRWGTSELPVATRREEDLQACGRLGAAAMHFGLPEALYRKDESGRPLYPSEHSIFGEVHPGDRATVEALTEALHEVGLAGAQLYVPLAVGGHVDHRVLRASAEALQKPVWYYHDLPYAMRGGKLPAGMRVPNGVESIQPLDPDDETAWVEAAACYRSQESTFWDDFEPLSDELSAYLNQQGGMHILAPPRQA